MYDVDDALRCFQSPKLLSELGADLDQIRSRTAALAGSAISAAHRRGRGRDYTALE